MKIKKYPHLEILDTIFNEGCMFIIARDKITNKKQVYFGQTPNIDEYFDMEHVLGLGAKLPLEYFESFMDYRIK